MYIVVYMYYLSKEMREMPYLFMHRIHSLIACALYLPLSLGASGSCILVIVLSPSLDSLQHSHIQDNKQFECYHQ